jgi:DNA-directed RNA polymerase specialized sigma24 family protein
MTAPSSTNSSDIPFATTDVPLLKGLGSIEGPLDAKGQQSWVAFYGNYRKSCLHMVAKTSFAADADRIANDLLIHLLENQRLKNYDPKKGRFRWYLTRCVKHYLNDLRRAQHRRKEVSLTEPMLALTVDPATARGQDCTRESDKAYAVGLFETAVVQCISRWRREDAGRAADISDEEYVRWLVSNDYAEIGRRLGNAPNTAYQRMRKRRGDVFRAFRALVARGTAPSELDAEVDYLAGLLEIDAISRNVDSENTENT